MAGKKIDTLDKSAWLNRIEKKDLQKRSDFLAMYSSWWDGIVTDPNLMLLAVDDHQVHRGDAVFEAIKVINKKIYLCKEHLDRMERSSASIGLKSPFRREELIDIMKQTIEVSSAKDAILRLFLSRGPGSFTPNPYDTLGAQFYLIVTKLHPVPDEKIMNGVSVLTSKIPPKEPWLARIKSCNYLQNVLMKKEAIDRGVDFTLGVNQEGLITEGSTENLILLNESNELVRPRSENILLGTTMQRAFELSKSLPEIKGFKEQDLKLSDVLRAKEVMMVGTTLDVISVTKFEGSPVGNGRPGPIADQLRALVQADQKN